MYSLQVHVVSDLTAYSGILCKPVENWHIADNGATIDDSYCFVTENPTIDRCTIDSGYVVLRDARNRDIRRDAGQVGIFVRCRDYAAELGYNLFVYSTVEGAAALPRTPAERDAGITLHSAYAEKLRPYARVRVDTGVGVRVPQGHFGQVMQHPYGGICIVVPTIVVGDSKIIVEVFNPTPHVVQIEKDRIIAQMVIIPFLRAQTYR